MQIVNSKLPLLKHVSRPTAWQILTFAVFNVLLGSLLFVANTNQLHFFIVNNILTAQFWGATYIALGVVMLWGYFTNNWHVMRYTNVPSLFVKLFWLLALVIHQIQFSSGDIYLIIMFGALASIQTSLYIYFPTDKEADSKVPVGNITVAKEVFK